MEENRPSRQPQRPTALDVNLMTDSELERFDIFTPDEEYFTPPTAAPVSQSTVYSQTEYRPRTLRPQDRARQSILPPFPPRSTLISMVRSETTTTTTTASIPGHARTNEEIDLLLCNVPSK